MANNNELNKKTKMLLVILLPLGIVYCIGKNLFGSNFVAFLGGVLIFAAGFLLALFLLRPDIVEPIVNLFSR